MSGTDVTGIDASMRQLIDPLVDQLPGVTGALVSSADGFVLAARLPEGVDAAAVAAMSASMLGLADRLVQLNGPARAAFSHQRSDDGQVLVFAIAGVAALTVLADPTADVERTRAVGREITRGLQRLFRGTADV